MSANPRVLFVTHKKAKCGVYEFWSDVFSILKTSTKYDLILSESSTFSEFYQTYSKARPDLVIFNYHPATLNWLTIPVIPHHLRFNLSHFLKAKTAGIIHEYTSQYVSQASASRQFSFRPDLSAVQAFDFIIAPDPTLVSDKPNVFSTWRLIPQAHSKISPPEWVTIWSFWLGTPHKGFEKIVDAVQDEFDEADIRFNIPYADFGDKTWEYARKIAEECRSKIRKNRIRLFISHDFLNNDALFDFLSGNTLNLFLYDNPPSSIRGISSAVEKALAVHRPIGISSSLMFRHMKDAANLIEFWRPGNSLKELIARGDAPLRGYYEKWSSASLLSRYEEIIASIL